MNNKNDLDAKWTTNLQHILQECENIQQYGSYEWTAHNEQSVEEKKVKSLPISLYDTW